MKNLLYLFLIAGVVSCGKLKPEGEITTNEVELQDFNKVDLKGNFRVFYVKDTLNMVSVDTYPNIFKNLEFKVKDQTLSISEKKKTEGVDMNNITLYSKNSLSQIAMRDSADMTISTQMSETEFELSLMDNAKFSGSILANKAKITMDDKSRANLLGRTIDADVAIRDTASIIAPYWYVENLNLDSKNENYTEISIGKNLQGKISNTSKLLYYGDPIKKIEVKDKANIEQKKQP